MGHLSCLQPWHSNRKWWILSLSALQCVQRGESILLTQNRYALSAMWPTQNCISRLDCDLLRAAVSPWYLFDCREGLFPESLVKWGKSFHQSFQSSLSSCAYCCFRADTLLGRGLLRRKLGRLGAGLTSPLAAALTSSSALPLPAALSWPLTQCSSRL